MTVARALPFLILLCSFALPAQVEARTAPPVAEQQPPPVVVTMSFRGGTLAEFVAALRAAEAKANVVVAAAAASAKVPAIELRGAGIGQALDAACMVAESEYPVRCKDFQGPGEPVYSVITTAPTMISGTAQMAVKTEDSTQVFSLNRLTETDPRMTVPEGLKVETILSAIEAGTGDDAKKIVLRFHRDSGLLFVRGTRSQIGMVKDLLSSLERDLEERRRRAAPTPQPQATAGKPAGKDGDK